MDKSLAIERMSETENLTDALNDDDANWLLEWGASHVGGLIAGIADDEAAGEKVNQLMAVMRSLNGIAGDHDAKDPADLADDIKKLSAQYATAFGAVATHSDGDVAQLAQALPTLSQRAVMQRLLDFLALAQPSSAHAQPAQVSQLSQASQPPSATPQTQTQTSPTKTQLASATPPAKPATQATQSTQDHAEPESAPEAEPEPAPRTPSDH